MMQKTAFLLTVCVSLMALLASCGDSKAPAETTLDLKKELPGTWDAVSFKYIVHSANNDPELDTIVETREEEWEKRYLTHPPRTFFLLDNKFRKEFRLLTGDTLNATRGIWNVFGDTLLFIEADTTYQYTVKIDKGMAEFHSILDADDDGQEDDEYIEVHRRVSRTAE